MVCVVCVCVYVVMVTWKNKKQKKKDRGCIVFQSYRKMPMRNIGRYACALDIDGVLVRGNKPIRGALESIKLLQSHRIPFVCLTNGMYACITN